MNTWFSLSFAVRNVMTERVAGSWCTILNHYCEGCDKYEWSLSHLRPLNRKRTILQVEHFTTFYWSFVWERNEIAKFPHSRRATPCRLLVTHCWFKAITDIRRWIIQFQQVMSKWFSWDCWSQVERVQNILLRVALQVLYFGFGLQKRQWRRRSQ